MSRLLLMTGPYTRKHKTIIGVNYEFFTIQNNLLLKLLGFLCLCCRLCCESCRVRHCTIGALYTCVPRLKNIRLSGSLQDLVINLSGASLGRRLVKGCGGQKSLGECPGTKLQKEVQGLCLQKLMTVWYSYRPTTMTYSERKQQNIFQLSFIQ